MGWKEILTLGTLSRLIAVIRFRFRHRTQVRAMNKILKQSFRSRKYRGYQLSVLCLLLKELQSHGVKLNDNLTLAGWPYLRDQIDCSNLDAQELINLVKLLRHSIKYGVVFSKLTNPIILQNEVALDISNKRIVTSSGVSFRLDSIEPWILLETFYLRIHDLGDVRGLTIADVGAAFGDTALFYASKGAKVIAIEPVNYDYMVNNLKLNPDLSALITPVRLAMGKDGKLIFTVADGIVDGDAYASSRTTNTGLIYATGGTKSEVVSMTLSRILRAYGVEAVDIAKIDCKGCEESLTETDLSLVRQIIKIEYITNSSGKLEDLLDKLKRTGFKAYCYLHNPEYSGPLSEHGTIIGYRTASAINN